MKKIIFLIVPLLTIIASSCMESGNNSSSTNSNSPEVSVPVKTPATVEQAVITFDVPGEVSLARNFYFLFDCSGSMDDGCSGKKKIEGAKEAMLRFLKTLPPDANIGLLAFGVENEIGCKEILLLGKHDYPTIEKAVASFQPTGRTPLAKAIALGTDRLVNQYKNQLGYGEFRLIAITDGYNNEGNLNSSCENLSRYGFISLYSIGLCMDSDNELKSFALSSRDASNYEELEKALVETAAETDTFDASVFDSTLFVK